MIFSGFYKVAGHFFEVSASADLGEKVFAECMDNYEPFVVPAVQNSDCLFKVNVECGDAPEYVEELCQDEEGQQIICGTIQEKSVFDFRLLQKLTGVLVCAQDYKTATLFVPKDEPLSMLKFAVNNAMMVLYAIASAPYNTALFHAAVVNYDGKGRDELFVTFAKNKPYCYDSFHDGLWHCRKSILHQENHRRDQNPQQQAAGSCLEASQRVAFH